jgi:hypothetical protein
MRAAGRRTIGSAESDEPNHLGDTIHPYPALDRASRERDAASVLPGRYDPLATSLAVSVLAFDFEANNLQTVE